MSKTKAKEYAQLYQLLPMLNNWWGGTFKKTPASGALRWGGAENYWVYGDIVPPENFPFVIECKNYTEICTDEIIRKPADQGRITYFWYYQTVVDAERATKELGRPFLPMLIYKINRMTNRIVIDERIWLLFPEELRKQVPHLRCNVPGREPFVLSESTSFFAILTKDVVTTALLQIQSQRE